MIVLASGSPRRRQLLEMIGLEFRVVPPEVDESLGPAEQAEGYVTRLAREKATTVARRERGAVVLAADTTVVLRGTIFGKPANPEEAAEMLRQLEGRKHQVMTAVAVAQDGRVEHALDVTDVTFRPLTDAQIAAYVATGEPLDKAGAYAIQGKGAALVEGIRGDFFGVMGLPLRLALEVLDRRGLLQLLVERLRDEDLVGPRGVAEALGGIHCITDHGILEPPIRADVAREYFAEVDADPDAELGATLLFPLRVELLERCQLIERAAHGAVGVVLVHHGRAPQRHDRVPDELVERAAVLEHDLHHLGEVLREEGGDGVRTHRLRHRREAANIREEEDDRSLFTGEPARILLLRDDLRDVGREVALEVREHQRLAPHLLRALRVLDRHRGERPERDQELEVVVGEGVRRGEVVHVEDPQDLLVRTHERGAHRAADAL